MSDVGQLDRALAAIDDANADDPDTIVIDGQVRPKEQGHAELMSDWVRRLDPEATDAQLLAARAEQGEEKTIGIDRKTTAKMSARGIAAASALELAPEARALLERAMATAEKP